MGAVLSTHPVLRAFNTLSTRVVSKTCWFSKLYMMLIKCKRF